MNGIDSSIPTAAPKHSSPLHDDVREAMPRMGPYNVNGTAATVSTIGRIGDSVHRGGWWGSQPAGSLCIVNEQLLRSETATAAMSNPVPPRSFALARLVSIVMPRGPATGMPPPRTEAAATADDIDVTREELDEGVVGDAVRVLARREQRHQIDDVDDAEAELRRGRYP